MDGSDYNGDGDSIQRLKQCDLESELAYRPAPLCYSRFEKLDAPEDNGSRYDVLVAAVAFSAAVGFATLCFAIA